MFTVLGLILVLSVAGCHGNTLRMGACPRVTVMETMDFDRFLGTWYVVQRFNPMATCTKIVLEKDPEGKYSVNETSRPLGLNFGFHNQYMKTRGIHFLRNDTTSIFRIERNFAHFTLSTFGVVETDYDNYAILWGCDPALFGSIQNVDILSRQPTLTADMMKSVRVMLKNTNIDYHPLDNVDQAHCAEAGSGTEGVATPEEKNTNNIVAG